ncbi:MAG: DUF5011 domain-containing protein, partial [Candidatus Latescibacteria bacterium]|nr:DUF5011 domain-containing protein [Candidatus Latescibacterota bacterium]
GCPQICWCENIRLLPNTTDPKRGSRSQSLANAPVEAHSGHLNPLSDHECIPNNLGWVIGHDNGGFDRSLNLHDSRYGGVGAHVAGGTGGFSPYPSSLPLSLNQWHCVAVAYNAGAGTATFYLDGVVQTVLANPGPGLANTTLGGLQIFGGHTVDALVDEVFIFNRALTPLEINQVSFDLSDCVPLSPPAFSGLVSWWRAEGNFQDSADGNHGFPVGTVGFVPGIGQAFNFNGSSAVAVPSSPSLNFGTGNFSGAFWVKTTAPATGNFLVEKDIPGVGGSDWFVHMVGAGQIQFVVGPGGDPSAVSSGHPPINDGVFHHVAFVRNGTLLSVYIDGVLRGQAITPFVGSVSNGVKFVMGAEINNEGTNNLVNTSVSVIDEITMYNGALTSPEIRALAGDDSTPPVITLNGANPMTLTSPTPYVEPGATVSDDCDPSPILMITGSVNANVPGTYTITYTATDHSGNITTATRTVNVVAPPPPFSIDRPLPDPNAHICLPPFMVQDPSKTHSWWARATGSGNLEIELIAIGINPAETGSATVKVFDPSGTQAGTATVNHPATGEVSATPVVVPGATAGALYRIEVSVGPSSPLPPSPTPQARHYRLELKGASLLGANSPLQAQSEHDNARWIVNGSSGETLNVLVSGGPEAPATAGTVEARNPGGVLVTSPPIGTPVLVPGATGQWTITVRNANGHYIIDKTSGPDKGLYVAWDTWGFGTISGAITRGGAPNTTPVTVEIKDALTGTVVQTIPATSSYTSLLLAVGNYTVQVVVPPNLQAPPPATRAVTCDGQAVANFDIPNREPICENAAPSIAEIWPPNHKMVDVSILNVTDPDGDPVTITITKITQDEPLNTVGDGNTEPDGAILGPNHAQVRAERTGTKKVPGNGRCYHISFTASDGLPQGGTCEGVVEVCVPHDQAHPPSTTARSTTRSPARRWLRPSRSRRSLRRRRSST